MKRKTEHLNGLLSRYQNLKRLDRSAKRKGLSTPLDYVASLTMNECAELDHQGIKIVGIEYDIDFNDRSWAE